MGEVGVGDRGGLKQSMLETYLWDAVSSPCGQVKILPRCEVRIVTHARTAAEGAPWMFAEDQGDGGNASAVDEGADGRRRQRPCVTGVRAVVTLPAANDTTTTAVLDVRCPIVVVSCGSINSPALLLRSAQGDTTAAAVGGLADDSAGAGPLAGLNRSGMVGRNLRLHPVTGVMGLMPDAVDMWGGAPMTTVSEAVAAGRRGDHYGAKLEVPSVLPGYIAGLLPWESAAQYKELCLEMRRAFAFIVLARDNGDTGRITLDGKTGRPRLWYPLETCDRESLMDGMVTATRIAAAAGATHLGSSFSDMGLRELPPGHRRADACGRRGTGRGSRARRGQ